MKQINIIDEICFSLARMINLNLHGKVGHSTQPTSTFLDAINKTWPQKLIKWHPFNVCLRAPQYSPIQPSTAQYRPVHSSSSVLKWPSLVSKWPVENPRWPIYHYYGFDCTKLHLLSRDSIVSSIRGQDAILLIFGATF